MVLSFLHRFPIPSFRSVSKMFSLNEFGQSCSWFTSSVFVDVTKIFDVGTGAFLEHIFVCLLKFFFNSVEHKVWMGKIFTKGKIISLIDLIVTANLFFYYRLITQKRPIANFEWLYRAILTLVVILSNEFVAIAMKYCRNILKLIVITLLENSPNSQCSQ